MMFKLTCTVLLTVSMVLAALVMVRSQEKPARPTRTWRAFELSSRSTGSSADVDVIDTEGVCLYVARGITSIAIAAVPKTQLPAGAGCQ